MTPASTQKLDFAALLPGVGVFGGVRRFVEIGNELIRRGHSYTLYHPRGEPPEWLRFDGEVRHAASLSQARHQILICNDPPMLELFEGARADLKCFYFALENLPGEKSIATHPGWVMLANSTGMYERIRRKYQVNVEKVIGGITLDLFKPRERKVDPDYYRVLTFGRLSRKKKGVPIVIRSAESLARSVPGSVKPVKLVLFDHVGRDSRQDPRNEIRCSIPYEFNINLDQQALARLFASCDVFVSAEKKAGWANTTAEAMASGVPVVCTRSGTVDIATHRETAWVARWRHAHFIGRGLRALHGDAALAKRLSDNALEHIQRFSWPRVVDQLEEAVRRRIATP